MTEVAAATNVVGMTPEDHDRAEYETDRADWLSEMAARYDEDRGWAVLDELAWRGAYDEDMAVG